MFMLDNAFGLMWWFDVAEHAVGAKNIYVRNAFNILIPQNYHYQVHES